MYNFVVDSTFDGRRFERGGYQFFGVNKHDVYEITEPNTNLKKIPFSNVHKHCLTQLELSVGGNKIMGVY